MTRTFLLILALLCQGSAALAQGISAILEPGDMVEIRSTVDGRVDQVLVKEGDEVVQGAVLATIDARVQRARVALAKIAAESTGPVARAEITIEQAKALRDRVVRARNKGAAQAWEVTHAEQALQLTEADHKVAIEGMARSQSQMELEQAILSEFSMVAPFDGTVLQVYSTEGEIVDTEMTVLELGNLDRLQATAFIPLDWLDWLQEGSEVTATVGDGKTANGTVASVDPRVDPASLSVRIKIEFDNPERTYLAGTAISIFRP